jgi:hypothetical protein
VLYCQYHSHIELINILLSISQLRKGPVKRTTAISHGDVTKVANINDNNILYFPHIEIADVALLKSALCVWETVYRIVPGTYEPQDSDEVKRAIEAGALRDIHLSGNDLAETREEYNDFISSIRYLPDALDRRDREDQGDATPTGMQLGHIAGTMQESLYGSTTIHREKIDERLVVELAEVIGSISQEGDWLRLPRGLSECYMLYLSNVVSRRRNMPKFTDSDAMFVAMQYFAHNGAFDEDLIPETDQDLSAALILQQVVPQGIENAEMKEVLAFRKANRDGREAFRSSVNDLAKQLAKIDDEQYILDIARDYEKRMVESRKITFAHVIEHFWGVEPLLLYLGLPLAASAFQGITNIKGAIMAVGAFGIAGIGAIADVMKARRKEWVPSEATYYCKLKQAFDSRSPIPKRLRLPGVLMDEFMND